MLLFVMNAFVRSSYIYSHRLRLNDFIGEYFLSVYKSWANGRDFIKIPELVKARII